MFVWVTCSGVVVGSADFEPPFGLAHAQLEPTAGYVLVAAAAGEIGALLSRRLVWPRSAGDVADEMARRWSGGRLALMDQTGRELSVTNIVLVQDRALGRRVVADVLLPIQSREGWWEGQGGEEKGGGRVYATTMAMLSLAVKNHFLPIYQR